MLRPLLLCTILLVLAHSRLYYLEEKHIIQMGQIYWDNLRNDFRDGLFIFYDHPESIICKQLLPELETAATDLFHIKSIIQFAKIDCHDEAKVCEMMGVNSYPTLILYKGDQQYEYFGARRAQLIKEWLQRIVDDTYPICDHDENLFKRFNTAILMNNVNDAANVMEAYKHLIDEIEIIQDHGDLFMKSLGGDGSIYSQGMEVIKYRKEDSSSYIVDKIESLLYKEKTAIPNFNARAWKKLKESEEIDYVFFFRTAKYSPLAEGTAAFNKVARDNKGEDIQFVYVNADDAFGETLSKWFGVALSGESVVSAISKENGLLKKYRLDTAIALNEGSISKFVRDFKSGILPRYYMSASLPLADQQHVKRLVGSNFAKVTQDPDKNVFVLLYFPWNSEYLRINNHFRALQSRLRNHPNVVIAKIDVSENDTEGADPAEFPAILLFPSGEYKTPIAYEATVTIAGLQNFLMRYIGGLEMEFDL